MVIYRMGAARTHHFVCGVFEIRIKKPCLNLSLLSSPSGNTRLREHDADPNPWFLASRLLRSLAENARIKATSAETRHTPTVPTRR